MLIVRIIENNTMYSMQELHLFLCLFSLAIFTSSIFSVNQLIFSCTYSFHNLDILQHHMIYRIRIHNYEDSKYILCRIHLYQLIVCIDTWIYHYSIVVYYYKHLHLICIYAFTFHSIRCVLFR